jgi:YbbR domain-containing protein
MSAGDDFDDEPPRGLLARLIPLLVENWSLKLAALVVSLALYVVLHGGGESVRTLEVDLIRGPEKDPNKVLLTPIPLRAHVTVQGPRTLIDDLSNPIDTLSLDLTGNPANVRLEDYPIKLPPGVRKLSLTPSSINLRWDTRISKRVKVEPSFSERPEGLTLRVGSVQTTPATIVLTGPKSKVDAVQNLHTATIELKDRPVGTHIQSVFVNKLDERDLDSTVTMDPDQVEVRFELIPETKTRTFVNVPIMVLKGRGVTLRPRNVSVVVTCSPRRADELRDDAIVPKIDLEALGPDFAKKGPEEADVKIEVPGCSDAVVTPSRTAVSR